MRRLGAPPPDQLGLHLGAIEWQGLVIEIFLHIISYMIYNQVETVGKWGGSFWPRGIRSIGTCGTVFCGDKSFPDFAW